MDPLQDELTKLADYGDRVYAVRCVWYGEPESIWQGNQGAVELESKVDSQPGVDAETDSASDVEAGAAPEAETYNFINADGDTLATRIKTPEGYSRTEAEEGSLTEFLREYAVKPDGSPVILYDGDEKWNQDAHVAVFELPIEAKDLQQCADSVMRVYAEYFWATEQYDKIEFHFTNGFLASYNKWREGYRISVDGNDVSWKKSAEYDASYETFVKYLRMVFAYAGTLSMEQESEKIEVSEAYVGDVVLKGGSPGHVVLVVDVCENEQGERAFLLAQGYMPAQEFHVLKNPLHEKDPWYYEGEISGDIETPEYYFSEGSFKRLSYLD
ncbi:MAG: DUF4846 domain-containing protein [Lachnospiraceae bacterium]|nr:DUF4846 domain-containing protein [Lachnospiraceae bacterium]